MASNITHLKWLGKLTIFQDCQSVWHATTIISKDVAQRAIGMEDTVLLIIKRTFDQSMRSCWTLRDLHRISRLIVTHSTANIHVSNECDQLKALRMRLPPSWRCPRRTTAPTLTDALFAVYYLSQAIIPLAKQTKQGEHRCLQIVQILEA
jgi:hypothetical protein